MAEAIEAFFAGRLDRFYGLLAYHYARAGAPEHAMDYLLKAGDGAGHDAALAMGIHVWTDRATLNLVRLR